MPGPDQSTAPREGQDGRENLPGPQANPHDREDIWEGEHQEPKGDWEGYSQTILKHFV